MHMTESRTVIDQDGVRGTLMERAQQAGGGSTLARVRLPDGQAFLVREDMLTMAPDGNYHAPFRFADLQAQTGSERGVEHVVIPVVTETVDVQRRTRETGRVRITKTVQESTEVVDEPIFREEVRVERVPINRVIDQPVAEHYEGDVLVIPVLEETYVVEKRLVLKEELHVTKHRVEAHEPQDVTLRHEEVSIDRVDPENKEQGLPE
jgi:uncharacterized protein (TIGR02271 family)